MTGWLFAAGAAAAAAGIAYLTWQSRCPRRIDSILAHPRLPDSLDGKRIAHLSDLHSNRFGRGQSRLLSQVAAARPDLILFTGDLVDERTASVADCLDLLRGLAAIAPTYCILGNHEMRMEDARLWTLTEDIRRTGAILLRNSALDMGGWSLCGLDPVYTADARTTDGHVRMMEENLSSLEAALPPYPGFRLLMSHHPFRCAAMAGRGYGIILCGHTHGGQCRLPLIGPLTLPGATDRNYVRGPYAVADSLLYVSSGLGNSHLPLRTFNRVSWTLHTLRKGQPSA